MNSSQWSSRARLLLLVAASLLACAGAPRAVKAPPEPPADWTVLVFMNGDNNLEPQALSDFIEMNSVGSSEKLKVVVQFDRNGRYDSRYDGWKDTRRFLVRRNIDPNANAELQVLGEANMGDPKVLEDFVRWGMRTYPARHYALIIWDHGQGYRDLTVAPRAEVSRSVSGAAFRSVSHDETNRDQLYNSEVQQALRNALQGRKLDLLGFDACLMAMVETAYAMREFADVMVASEDLEPGDGWAYHLWLKQLRNHPDSSAEQLARSIVDTYPLDYRPSPNESTDRLTLSVVRLEALEPLASAVSDLADTLVRTLDSEVRLIQQARQASPVLARDHPNPGDQRFHHVDLTKFVQEYLGRTQDPNVRRALERVRSLNQQAVLQSFVGPVRADEGASGLAIYFPAGRRAYATDVYEEHGYQKDNTRYPVAFVQEQKWADFLHAYFTRVP
ncbi:clostripain-related cysteine peptidase [Corallococcus exercitus]|uniref:Clostripain n=1 Tax=Corallococcus exercitus TaxID=2316736 RepID=A0A7Y4JPP7_9BACT|nr:clostripain-related cysteine peptidase [Corallococcus exercitus]NOK08012.1 hypothetical protein [Corallococcus exercitus]